MDEKVENFRYWAQDDLWLSAFNLSWARALIEAGDKVAKGYWPALKIGHIEHGRLKIDIIITKSGTFISE